MEKVSLLTLTLLVSTGTIAEVALPYEITPLNSDVVLKYVPGHMSICTSTTSGTKTTMRIMKDSSGALNLWSGTAMEGNYLQITMGLNASGTGFSSAEPKFRSDKPLPESVLKLMKPILVGLSKKSVYALGVPLWQNKLVLVADDLCSLVPHASTKSHSGGFTVIGSTTIHGRETIIFRGQETLTCQISGLAQLEIQMTGWTGIDRLSGLYANSSISVDANGSSEAENTDCEITGVDASGPSVTKSVEQRLSELKLLLNKRLITQDQYELKRTEILSTL